MNDEFGPVGGFEFSGIHCGIKANGHKDIGLVFIPEGACLSGVYTTNQVVAAPVVLSRSHAKDRVVHALIVNSGNANACTGKQGDADALEMVKCVATELNVPISSVQVCSTGVIGQTLPMAKVIDGIKQAKIALSSGGVDDFTQAIRTTDLYHKAVRRQFKVGTNTYTIQGVAKGAGMIAPNMATMLAFVFTDAPIGPEDIDQIWGRVCSETFNSMTVDGDTSTNDTALLLAGNGSADYLIGMPRQNFEDELFKVCDELAHLIIGDGEGATKAVRIEVTNARTKQDARTVADVIARSPLVKTALHGQDPNWGRIIAAVGRSGISIHPSRIELSFNGHTLYQNEAWCGADAEALVCDVMKLSRYTIEVNLNLGNEKSHVLTCDLSADYVRINADYRS